MGFVILQEPIKTNMNQFLIYGIKEEKFTLMKSKKNLTFAKTLKLSSDKKNRLL